MQYNEFIKEIKDKTQLDKEGAEKAARPTLETLSERLTGNEAEHLSSQLSEEMKSYIHEGDLTGKFSADEFFEKISEKEGVELDKAKEHAKVVADVLETAITPGEIDHIRAQLPKDFQKLFKSN